MRLIKRRSRKKIKAKNAIRVTQTSIQVSQIHPCGEDNLVHIENLILSWMKALNQRHIGTFYSTTNSKLNDFMNLAYSHWTATILVAGDLHWYRWTISRSYGALHNIWTRFMLIRNWIGFYTRLNWISKMPSKCTTPTIAAQVKKRLSTRSATHIKCMKQVKWQQRRQNQV